MNFLITGGCGFLGSNLAEAVLARGDRLSVLDNLARAGSKDNLDWLRRLGKFDFFEADVGNCDSVRATVRAAKPDVLFHLAGQVAMTTSIENPALDFATNVIGGLNVLEAVRQECPDASVIYSSTNKVYGDLEYVDYQETPTRYLAPAYANGFDESVPLNFTTPYGCSKGAVDQYMLDYARTYSLNTVVFRHSSIFGPRQFSTRDQGWLGWFTRQALERAQRKIREPFTISGNGKQVRDVLFASDLVKLYLSAVDKIDKARGEAFNIGGGMPNSLSLLELFSLLEERLHVKLEYSQLPWRSSDQKVFIADISKATRLLDWQPRVSKDDGINEMIQWTTQYV